MIPAAEYERLTLLLREAERAVRAQRKLVQDVARLLGVCLECGEMKPCSCRKQKVRHA